MVSTGNAYKKSNAPFKNHITVVFNIFLMMIIEVNGHVVRDTEFGGFFQVIGDDDVAVFFEGDETQVEDFVGVGEELRRVGTLLIPTCCHVARSAWA